MATRLRAYLTQAKKLHKLLPKQSICASGEFPCMPILQVQNQFIPFPFEQHGYEKLVSLSSPSPFGINDKTIVDKSVRKSFEIDGKNVTMHPDFLKSIQEQAVARVKQTLTASYKNAISAELYKVVLYKEGDFFKPHKDTARSKNHFGTLVLMLPSVYSGGELLVQHHDQQYELFKNPCVAKVAWGAFFGDCTHEVKPVTSGHRIAMLFNLKSHNSEETNTITAPSWTSEHKKQIIDLIDSVFASQREEHLGIFLEHLYGEDMLNQAYLKGSDYALYWTLQENFDIEIENINTTIIDHIESTDGVFETIDTTEMLNYLNDQDLFEIETMSHKYYWFYSGESIENCDESAKLTDITETDNCNEYSKEKSTSYHCRKPKPKNIQFLFTIPQVEKCKVAEKDVGGYMGNESASPKLRYEHTAFILTKKRNQIIASQTKE